MSPEYDTEFFDRNVERVAVPAGISLYAPISVVNFLVTVSLPRSAFFLRLFSVDSSLRA